MDPQVGEEVVQGEAVVVEAELVVLLRDWGEAPWVPALLRERTTMPCGGAKAQKTWAHWLWRCKFKFEFQI